MARVVITDSLKRKMAKAASNVRIKHGIGIAPNTVTSNMS